LRAAWRAYTADAIAERQWLMARIWRKPGVLMTAYLVLFVIAEAWRGSRSSGLAPHQLIPDLGSPLIAAFLAWRVTHGGAFSRGLIIVFTITVMQRLLWGADLKSGGLVSLGLLAICLAQIALLVSTPIYERTRKDWADRPPSGARPWPTPPWWIALVAVTAGLFITLLFLGSEDFQSVPCLPASPAAAPAQCVTLAQGFPVHFLSASPSDSYAVPVINKGAAAEDMAVWTVLSFAACYLFWLPSRRPAEAPVGEVAAHV
jgi:hypothetical protein